MVQHEILDEFYNKLSENGIEDEIITQLEDLITDDNFSKENLIDLIEGVLDG